MGNFCSLLTAELVAAAVEQNFNFLSELCCFLLAALAAGKFPFNLHDGDGKASERRKASRKNGIKIENYSFGRRGRQGRRLLLEKIKIILPIFQFPFLLDLQTFVTSNKFLLSAIYMLSAERIRKGFGKSVHQQTSLFAEASARRYRIKDLIKIQPEI